MKITPTRLKDVLLIEPQLFGDDRGYFFEAYHKVKWAQQGIDYDFVQDNQSQSVKGTLRGLHYQLPPSAQAKLVRCISGKIFDVAVDIRKNSPTFGEWTGHILSAENKNQLLIPEGFAHGFYTISDTAEVLYKCNAHYDPTTERSLLWNDEEVAIDWQIEAGTNPILSEKDSKATLLSKAALF